LLDIKIWQWILQDPKPRMALLAMASSKLKDQISSFRNFFYFLTEDGERDNWRNTVDATQSDTISSRHPSLRYQDHQDIGINI
jgi:hypothetical protein